ncbi:MAG: energy-coupling factor transporter transmembrane protein EcfT [Eubacterium sp.]|nr:energy-coupling factor transporter transmembrane protein EcfT [Eubacterium sp.]
MGYKLNRDIHSFLDPRTKLLLMLTSSIFVIGGAGEEWMHVFYWILVYIPVFLLLIEKKWKAAFISALVYAASFYAQLLLRGDLNGVESAFALMIYIITRMLPTIVLAQYIVRTTKVSEFLAAMQRMHVSDKITIPMSVIFRFFPTIKEEYHSINDAMRMRGVELGGKKAYEIIEYRMVPLIAMCTMIGEELSAAAISRGLEVGEKRSCIWQIKFRFPDYIMFLFCLACFAWWIAGRFF